MVPPYLSFSENSNLRRRYTPNSISVDKFQCLLTDWLTAITLWSKRHVMQSRQMSVCNIICSCLFYLSRKHSLKNEFQNISEQEQVWNCGKQNQICLFAAHFALSHHMCACPLCLTLILLLFFICYYPLYLSYCFCFVVFLFFSIRFW